MHNTQRHPGSIDFEPIDVSEARKALDELPAGLVDPSNKPEFWISRRRKPGATDRALAGATLEWVVRLPKIVQPRKLCERFPRIANALAQAWPDKPQCEEMLANLRTDRRGKRQGFAPDVKLEIDRLSAFRGTQR
jgi:hypothetical protein